MDREFNIRALLDMETESASLPNVEAADLEDDSMAIAAIWGILDFDDSRPPQPRTPSPLDLDEAAPESESAETPTGFIDPAYLEEVQQDSGPTTPKNQAIKRRSIASLDQSRKLRRMATSDADGADAAEMIAFDHDTNIYQLLPVPIDMRDTVFNAAGAEADQITNTDTDMDPIPPPLLPLPAAAVM